MAKTNLNDALSSNFKDSGDLIYLLSVDKNIEKSLTHSVFSNYFEVDKDLITAPDLEENIKFYRSLYGYNHNHGFQSCHDVSEGGVITSVVESAFTSSFGVDLEERNLNFFFNENMGQFVVSVKPDDREKFETAFGQFSCEYLGVVSSSGQISTSKEECTVNELFDLWQGP